MAHLIRRPKPASLLAIVSLQGLNITRTKCNDEPIIKYSESTSFLMSDGFRGQYVYLNPSTPSIIFAFPSSLLLFARQNATVQPATTLIMTK